MGAVLLLAAIFFAVVCVFELRDFYSRVQHRPLDLRAELAAFKASADPATLDTPAYLRFKVLAVLEAGVLQRRYHQANAAPRLLTRGQSTYQATANVNVRTWPSINHERLQVLPLKAGAAVLGEVDGRLELRFDDGNRRLRIECLHAADRS